MMLQPKPSYKAILNFAAMAAKSVGTHSTISAVFCPLSPLPPYNVDLFRDMDSIT